MWFDLIYLQGLNAETKLRHGELEREIREGEMLVQKTKDSLEVQKQLVVDLYKKLEFVGVKEVCRKPLEMKHFADLFRHSFPFCFFFPAKT